MKRIKGEIMKVLVIGAGASGMVAAIKAQENGAEVTIIEKNNKVGKKLLLTGNGRCNFWNANQDLTKYHSQDRDIMEEIIEVRKDDVLPFFKSIGLVWKNVNDYYYPFSNQAVSVVNVLKWKIEKLNIAVHLEEEVLKIEKNQKFRVETNKGSYLFDKVVIAMGSKANPFTGSDGKGYELAKKLGHTINKIYPSLTMIYGADNFYKDWEGVRSEAILTLIEEGKAIKEEQGEVQFTNYGISGICSFNLSGLIAGGLDNKKEEVVSLNLVPWFKGSNQEFKEYLDEQSKELANYTCGEILEGFLNYKLVKVIFKRAGLNSNKNWEDINKDKIIAKLRSFPIKVQKVGDYEKAQVCRGGVPLREISPKTLESKIVPGLYFTGEILDVDGDCGGYNLGFAWVSGLIVGEAIND